MDDQFLFEMPVGEPAPPPSDRAHEGGIPRMGVQTASKSAFVRVLWTTFFLTTIKREVYGSTSKDWI